MTRKQAFECLKSAERNLEYTRRVYGVNSGEAQIAESDYADARQAYFKSLNPELFPN